LFTIVKAIACIKIDKQPLLISLWISVKYSINLGNTWKNRPTHENGEHSMLIDINGDGLPDRVFDRNPKTDQQGLFVYLNTYVNQHRVFAVCVRWAVFPIIT
jgi:hypothetical protein